MQPVSVRNDESVPEGTGSGYRFFHALQPGQSLASLADTYYNPRAPAMREKILQQLLRDNQHIPSPLVASPFALVQLREPFQVLKPSPYERSDTARALQSWAGMDPQEKEWSLEHASLLATFMGGTFTKGAEIISESRILIFQIAEEYKKFKSGKISKHIYSSNRSHLLRLYDNRVGGTLHRAIGATKKATEHYRVRPIRGQIAADPKLLKDVNPLSKQLDKLARACKILRFGNILMTSLGVIYAGYEIHEAWDTPERGKVITKNVASIGGGLWVTVVLSQVVSGGIVVMLGVGTMAAIWSKGFGDYTEGLYSKGDR